MKITMLVQREDDIAWVEEATDEYTIDSIGGYPESWHERLTQADYRLLTVDVPGDDPLTQLWDVPVVSGTVTQ